MPGALGCRAHAPGSRVRGGEGGQQAPRARARIRGDGARGSGGQRFDGEPARHVARGVAAHAVGHGVERASGRTRNASSLRRGAGRGPSGEAVPVHALVLAGWWARPLPLRVRVMRKSHTDPVRSLLAGCGAAPPEEPPMQATAAVMLEVRPGMPLDEMLHILDEHLVRAMAGRWKARPSTTSAAPRRSATACSRRACPSSGFPTSSTAWSPGSARSSPRPTASSPSSRPARRATPMLDELRALRDEVVRLRQTVARGGTRAPPPIERLLRGDTTAAAHARRGARPPHKRPPRVRRPAGYADPPGHLNICRRAVAPGADRPSRGQLPCLPMNGRSVRTGPKRAGPVSGRGQNVRWKAIGAWSR
jgi:hypothetical protein